MRCIIDRIFARQTIIIGVLFVSSFASLAGDLDYYPNQHQIQNVQKLAQQFEITTRLTLNQSIRVAPRLRSREFQSKQEYAALLLLQSLNHQAGQFLQKVRQSRQNPQLSEESFYLLLEKFRRARSEFDKINGRRIYPHLFEGIIREFSILRLYYDTNWVNVIHDLQKLFTVAETMAIHLDQVRAVDPYRKKLVLDHLGRLPQSIDSVLSLSQRNEQNSDHQHFFRLISRVELLVTTFLSDFDHAGFEAPATIWYTAFLKAWKSLRQEVYP